MFKYLERLLTQHEAGAPLHEFAKAKLAALNGNVAAASAWLYDVLQKHGENLADDDAIFTNVLHVALLTFQLDLAADAINRRFRSGGWFRIMFEDRKPSWLTVIECRFHGGSSALFSISDELRTSERFDFVVNRWIAILPLFAEYCHQGVVEVGQVEINLNDGGGVPGLAFCESRSDYFLIPDPPYLATRGYESLGLYFARNDVA
jgi:hypothetical protein